MNDYPEKTCSADRLVRQKKLVEAVLAGRKTEQRRDGIYAYPGETFELEGRVFEVVSLRQEALGNLDDAGARAEGFGSLEQYKALIVGMHKGMEWDPGHLVWVHSFAPKSTPEDPPAG
ncbi:MAG: ASCH domain-containing protein [bacterium]|nr:hypothetical protein [Deltaproteobacteria bacterium]MCP4905155.1 ASCH domain-containing protein [bacterium]